MRRFLACLSLTVLAAMALVGPAPTCVAARGPIILVPRQGNPRPTNPQPTPQPPPTTPGNVDGVIASVVAGELRVISDKDRQPWTVAVLPRTKVQATGSAEPSFLRVGLEVEFSAVADELGVVREKVKAMKIVGAKPGSHSSAKPAGQSDGAAAKQPASNDGARPEKSSGPAPTKFSGRISAVRDAIVTVNANRQVIQFVVDPNAHIDIDSADATLAQPGDKISAKGLIVSGKSLLQANEVKITIPEPRTAKKRLPL